MSTKPDICRRKHGGNPNSEAANERAQKKRDGDRILAFLRFRGPLTCETIALEMKLPYTAVSARLSEMKRDGYVEETGKTRATTHGRQAAIIRAVPAEVLDKRKRQPTLFALN